MNKVLFKQIKMNCLLFVHELGTLDMIHRYLRSRIVLKTVKIFLQQFPLFFFP